MSMSQIKDTKSSAENTSSLDFEQATRTFQQEGYVVFPNLVSKAWLTRHTQELCDAFDRANDAGPLFSGGGGMVMGHLNCFPGQQTRAIYDRLTETGVIDFIRSLWPRATGQPNVGCNFNLPRSSAQNYHMDGYAADAFPIVNIASVDTTAVNGALDVLERTHVREYEYWQIVLERPRSIRVAMQQGDVLIRSSMLWHRGMPNRSSRARPMLAFTWEDGGSELPDPFAKNGGAIGFYSNRYAENAMGRFRERAFLAAPSVNSAARFVWSFVKR